MRPPGFSRHLLAVLLFALSAALGGCIVLPDTTVRQDRMSYAASPLLNLPDGKVVYLVQDCFQSFVRPGESFRCEHAASRLAVRPAQWDLPAEVRARLGSRKPGEGFDLADQMGIVAGRDYRRPASAQHDTAAIFVGFFTGFGFVWVRPDAAGRWQYEVVSRSYNENESFRPAMVVRDGDDVWAFVERDSPCNEDLCRPVAATLGLAEEDLPEDLRGGFMLYHASISGDAILRRVLPLELQRFLERGPLPLPRADRHYQTDVHRQAALDITTYQPDVLCLIRSASTEYIYFPMLASKHGDSTTQLQACERFVPKAPAGERLPPLNRPTQPKPVFDDPIVQRERSSYYCWPESPPGLPQYGKGRYACSFIMRDPETQAALPNIPYLIWLEGGDGAELEVKGVTNAQGRTAVVRSEQPIILRHLRVSRRVGPADLRPAAESPAWKGRSAVAEAVGQHLVRATDGRGIPGQSYRLQVCSGRTLDAQTDEAGWTVAYDAPKGPACPLQFIFGSAERRREN